MTRARAVSADDDGSVGAVTGVDDGDDRDDKESAIIAKVVGRKK
jgi:hypothetical protein